MRNPQRFSFRGEIIKLKDDTSAFVYEKMASALVFIVGE